MTSKILERFKIAPTQHRIEVLTLILSKTKGQFSAEDIVSESTHLKTLLSKSVVNKILRLFCVRGIIQMVDLRKTLQRGRPELLFIISPDLQNSDIMNE
jgi:Fe2+ or Zn2+ uptake regulation protein